MIVVAVFVLGVVVGVSGVVVYFVLDARADRRRRYHRAAQW